MLAHGCMRARMSLYTHTRTHARTHARTHTGHKPPPAHTSHGSRRPCAPRCISAAPRRVFDDGSICAVSLVLCVLGQVRHKFSWLGVAPRCKTLATKHAQACSYCSRCEHANGSPLLQLAAGFLYQREVIEVTVYNTFCPSILYYFLPSGSVRVAPPTSNWWLVHLLGCTGPQKLPTKLILTLLFYHIIRFACESMRVAPPISSWWLAHLLGCTGPPTLQKNQEVFLYYFLPAG